MKIVLTIGGVLLTCFGIIWFLQGMNVLQTPASFMTGQPRWAVYGCVAAGLGLTLIVVANRRRRRVAP